MEANLPVHTSANTLAEAESTKLGEKQGDINADALVYHSLTATHMAQRTTLALVYTLADTLAETKGERFVVKLRDIETEAPDGTVEKKAIIDKLPGTLPGLEEEFFKEITLQCGG